MFRSVTRFFTATILLTVFLAACATPLPSTYDIDESGRVLKGAVLAIGGDGDVVAAATDEGLFTKRGDGPWKNIEVPGIRKWNNITSLVMNDNVIYLGSDGEGLFIFSGGTWEIRNSRYGGLPDDGVLSIAMDDDDNGLPGEAVWVGTRDGLAVLKDGKWTIYKPGRNWLASITGSAGPGSGKVYVGSGFKLGRRGGDSDRFQPPVYAISAGPDRVVLGNHDSGLAVVKENAVSVIRFREKHKITDLVVDAAVIWAGTEDGLLWGGLRNHAEGKPWPTHHVYEGWSGTLYGLRDTRDFEYRWKRVGYNNAMVADLEKKAGDVWAAYRSKNGGSRNLKIKESRGTEEYNLNPITDVRRFPNIDEYISRKQKIQHESYGLSSGLSGKPNVLYVAPDNRKVWIGTTKGLWELEAY